MTSTQRNCRSENYCDADRGPGSAGSYCTFQPPHRAARTSAFSQSLSDEFAGILDVLQQVLQNARWKVEQRIALYMTEYTRKTDLRGDLRTDLHDDHSLLNNSASLDSLDHGEVLDIRYTASSLASRARQQTLMTGPTSITNLWTAYGYDFQKAMFQLWPNSVLHPRCPSSPGYIICWQCLSSPRPKQAITTFTTAIILYIQVYP